MQIRSAMVKASNSITSNSPVVGAKTTHANSPSQTSPCASHYSSLGKSPCSRTPEQKERSPKRSPLQELNQLQQDLKKYAYYNDGHDKYGQQTPRWHQNECHQDQVSKTTAIEKPISRRRPRLRRSASERTGTASASDAQLEKADTADTATTHTERVVSMPTLSKSKDRSHSISAGGHHATPTSQRRRGRRASVGDVPTSSGSHDITTQNTMGEDVPSRRRTTSVDVQLSTPEDPPSSPTNASTTSPAEPDDDLTFELPRLSSSSTRPQNTTRIPSHALTLSPSSMHRSRGVHVPEYPGTTNQPH